MGTDKEHRAAVIRAATQLRDLAKYLRAVRADHYDAGFDTTMLDTVLAELEPIVVDMHGAEIACAVGRVLDRHGPGPWLDADLAVLAGVDLTDLRQLRDQLLAAGLIPRADDLP